MTNIECIKLKIERLDRQIASNQAQILNLKISILQKQGLKFQLLCDLNDAGEMVQREACETLNDIEQVYTPSIN